MQADQLAGTGGLDVALGLGRSGSSLVVGGVAGDQAQAPLPRREPLAPQHPPDPVRGDLEPTPLLAAGGTDADLAREREEAQAEAEEDVIMRHRAHLHEVWQLSWSG
jgi:hypothetical protein